MTITAAPHIWVPNKQIIEVTRTEPFRGGSVAGHFKITGHLDDGRSRVIMDWQPNLITDAGLERWGTGAVNGFCHVGAGTTAPLVTDTALASWLATHTSIPSNLQGAQTSAPYYSWVRATYRFNPPGTNRTLGEVGVGWTTGNSGNLWSRSLIKDLAGNPTTITWLAAETLDVAYELRRYPWLVDVPYDDVISGVTYSGVQRCAGVTSVTYWPPYPYQAQTLLAGSQGNVPYLYGYSGDIGAITGTPSGVPGPAPSLSQAAYSANSLKRSGTYTFGPTIGFTARSWSFLTSICWMQKSISPDLVKPVDWTLVVNADSPTWGRLP